MSDTVRVNVYQDDPVQTWAAAADEGDDYYELPTRLLTDLQYAQVALDRARDAITAYIREHGVVKVSPW